MIPSNLIVAKYTQGNELIRTDNYASYQGYYYELNGKIYAGKEYSLSAIELIKAGSSKVNPLLSNPSTFTYGAISGQNIQSVKIVSVPFVATEENIKKGYAMRYFVKKTNENLIKETNQSLYNQVKGNSLYQSAEIKYNLKVGYGDYSKYDNQIPGLSSFIREQETIVSKEGEKLQFFNTVKKDLPISSTSQNKLDPNKGRKLEAPNVSSIPNSYLTLVKGPFETNPGDGTQFVDYLAVIDGKPVGANVAKQVMLMKRFAKQDGVILTVISGFRSPWKTINQMSLPSEKYPKGTLVTADSQVVCWNRNGCSPRLVEGVRRLGSGGGCETATAYPGTSNHSIAIAFDLNTGNRNKGNLNKKTYQWLIDYAWIFGFRRAVPSEEWHWEYHPGEWQFGDPGKVSKNNDRYNGMRLDPTPEVNKRAEEIKTALAASSTIKGAFKEIGRVVETSVLNLFKRG